MDKKLTILIAEDHLLVREAWVFMLNSDGRFSVIAETGNGDEAIELATLHKPDIVILDINLHGMNGMEAAALIRQHSPQSKILAASMQTQPAYVKQMMQKGAMGVISKNSSSQEMFKAIIAIYEGRIYICEEISEVLTEIMVNGKNGRTGINSLSPRELEVIEHIRNGSSSKQIASELNISQKTIEVHRYNIMKKLKLKNVAALVNYFNKGQLDFDERFSM